MYGLKNVVALIGGLLLLCQSEFMQGFNSH